MRVVLLLFCCAAVSSPAANGKRGTAGIWWERSIPRRSRRPGALAWRIPTNLRNPSPETTATHLEEQRAAWEGTRCS
jgi:hypothetical protein